MACYFIENVHTTSFTPKEFQVELLDACREKNTIVCLNHGPNKAFVTLKTLQEFSLPIRRPWHCGGKRSLYIGSKTSVNYYSRLIKLLTDLSVGEHICPLEEVNFEEEQVLAVTAEVCAEWIHSDKLSWDRINFVILEGCHNVLKSHPVREIILNLKGSDCNPRLLGLTSPLFTSDVQPGVVEAQLNQLEIDLNCEVETASDIVSILRFNVRPKEVILECFSHKSCDLSVRLVEEINDLREFLDDHRYDPTEIYEDNFLDELKDIPDPKKDPYGIMDDFLEVLNTMGPWCADKAALVLLVHIEKLKVKTPYERHYLLLCTTSTVLLKVRSICDEAFQGLTETEKITRYSSPKILRLVEVVRQFKPNRYFENERSSAVENSAASKQEDISSSVEVSNNNEKSFDLSEISVSDKGTCENSDTSPDSDSNCLSLNNSPSICPDNFNHIISNTDISKTSGAPPPCFVCGKINCSGSTDLNSRNTNESKSITKLTISDEKNPCRTDDMLVNGFEHEEGDSDKNLLEQFQSNNSEVPLTNGDCDCHKSTDSSYLRSEETNEAPKPEENNVMSNSLVPSSNASVPPKTSRWRGRGKGWRQRKGGGANQGRNVRHQQSDDADNLCGIVFVEKRFTAKILYHLFHDLQKSDADFSNISVQYTVGKVADPFSDPREAELEHRKQEEVLKRFRMRECNLVIATSVLEEGIELPKCNMIIRYDPVSNYKSHAYSKGRAKQQISYYISLIEQEKINNFLYTYAQYKCTEQLLLKRSNNYEIDDIEEKDADAYTHCVSPFRPSDDGPSVDMSSSIALVNRYCAKLPSDTFTRLTPLWSMRMINFNGQPMYYCTVRLPINSPVKEDIMGYPMPTKVLARRIAALETCRLLHSRGELDNNLEPIGKEAFNAGFDEEDLSPVSWDPNLPRPGTTKSRQYYYKKIASCLNECRPVAGAKCFLYNIEMVLTCPLPEEQNTRGRKLHPPELAPQAFGIVTSKQIPKVCPFPIFTRSGEVQVSLKLCSSEIILTERNVKAISTFLNFIFTSVLRLQKYLMSFDPEAKENSFFIVPTKKNEEGITQVDWDFLEVIYERKRECLSTIPDENRKDYVFEPEKYSDAVVMPWYRNQDQPQYFYVAEICYHLNPKSGFPGSFYKTFEDYYLKKYDIQIQNTTQPLLDVDHTSARLNFLTPRYVNRKGVALPTSSEETKRAKRENLEQKQILVGELCQVHVIPASLWRQAVCLPCILYRLNALLLADEIRLKVAEEIGLGLVKLPENFEWAPLDFGWSLADVLKKSRVDSEKKESDEKTNDVPVEEVKEEPPISSPPKQGNDEEGQKEDDKNSDDLSADGGHLDKDDDLSSQEEEKEKDDWMEIGTWSNDMAQLADDLGKDLPPELSMVRYGSPTSWDVQDNQSYDYYSSEGESDDSDEIFLESETSDSSDSGVGRLKITFRGDYLAEAVEDNAIEGNGMMEKHKSEEETWTWESEDLIPQVKEKIYEESQNFEFSIKENIEKIKESNMHVNAEEPFVIEKLRAKSNELELALLLKELPFKMDGYAMPEGLVAPSPPPYSPPPNTQEILFSSQEDEKLFSFDEQPELEGHPGPSPSILLQALTMSNANDGINLERLETIGDSFLKYAITTYLYCTHENIHEGKLSHLRSKQVSNLKLYRLGQKKVFGESMIASKFEPHDNWLPPCYLVPRDAEQQLLDSEPQASLPYNLVTQHSIPDKSIADCVEALIGAYLIECGPRGALIFMSWLGIKVLPKEEVKFSPPSPPKSRPVGSIITDESQVLYTELSSPESPLLRHVPDPEGELAALLSGFEALEASLHYSFRDKSYLLQAMSHASYSPNRITDCYQRLEFLGDAVLDYLITRHLFEDKRAHSPGALTDLRSALVNNTIFASLAVKHGLHKYFRHLSPGLAEVVQRFVTIQEENSHSISEEYYLVGEEAEDVEVPKALGDIFESIAGAIFLDSGMSLDTVWKVYYRMMKKEIEQFSTKVPKSPIRELLELEPETAKFSKPEKLADGRRVRVTVEVFGKGTFKGIGRNYRIAKCTAAKCALKQLKLGILAKKLTDNPGPSLLKVLRACHDVKNKY